MGELGTAELAQYGAPSTGLSIAIRFYTACNHRAAHAANGCCPAKHPEPNWHPCALQLSLLRRGLTNGCDVATGSAHLLSPISGKRSPLGREAAALAAATAGSPHTSQGPEQARRASVLGVHTACHHLLPAQCNAGSIARGGITWHTTAAVGAQENPGLNEQLAAILAAHLNQQQGGGVAAHTGPISAPGTSAATPTRGSGTAAHSLVEGVDAAGMTLDGATALSQHPEVASSFSVAPTDARAGSVGSVESVTTRRAQHSSMYSANERSNADAQPDVRPPSLDLWGAALPSRGNVLGGLAAEPLPADGAPNVSVSWQGVMPLDQTTLGRTAEHLTAGAQPGL